MAIVKVYNIKGIEQEPHEVPLSFVPKDGDAVLLSKTIRRQLANARRNYAFTKTRGEVRGGGAKPWRQKGTGRARHGSSRSPIWTGGGVTFGPRYRNFTENMNKKERRRAMQVAFMTRILKEDFIIVDDLEFSKPSTKQGALVLENLSLSGKSTLVLADRVEDKMFLSFRNIPKVNCLHADRANGFDLAKNEKVLVSRKAYELIEERWLS